MQIKAYERLFTPLMLHDSMRFVSAAILVEVRTDQGSVFPISAFQLKRQKVM
jgi:hypothetical protein